MGVALQSERLSERKEYVGGIDRPTEGTKRQNGVKEVFRAMRQQRGTTEHVIDLIVALRLCIHG
jgi:hypothetical protein